MKLEVDNKHAEDKQQSDESQTQHQTSNNHLSNPIIYCNLKPSLTQSCNL